MRHPQPRGCIFKGGYNAAPRPGAAVFKACTHPPNGRGQNQRFNIVVVASRHGRRAIGGMVELRASGQPTIPPRNRGNGITLAGGERRRGGGGGDDFAHDLWNMGWLPTLALSATNGGRTVACQTNADYTYQRGMLARLVRKSTERNAVI